MRAPMLPVGVLLCIVGFSCPRSTRAGGLSGTVRDASTGAPIEGAMIAAYPDSGGPVALARSGSDGRFSVTPKSGDYLTLRAWRIGYERMRLGPFRFSDPDSASLVFNLTPSAIRVDPVVVTVSRRSEKALEAPASVSVVSSRTIRERPGITVADYVRTLPGVDVASKGMTQTSVVARGFSSVQSSALLTLTDYRSAGLPSLRYNIYNFIPIPTEDIERIEVVRGPAAALYGPNCDRGVLHILTRSPFASPGTTVSVLSGEREAAQGSFRAAGLITQKLGVVLSGLYFRARDWKFTDPVETAARDTAIAHGADPATSRIGARDPMIERAGGEARLEWRMDSRTSAVLSGGINRALRNVDLTAIGAVQVRDWDTEYIQARATHDRFFGQVYVNASDAGGSYFLRTGTPIVDRSRLWAGQVQHGLSAGSKESLTYGVDAQRTEPRTGGTIDGRNESADGVTELGSYLHSRTLLSPQLELIAAIRADHHSRFQSPVLSPRAGLVYKPGESQDVRLTFNRAYRTPGSDDLFADALAGSLSPLPYFVRVEGVPTSGYTFQRDCGGPCMRSPFTPIAAGGPSAYLAPEATQEWGAVANILKDTFAGIDTVRAPTSADVKTVLATLNSRQSFDPAGPVSDLPRLRPTITNTIEAGYQGLVVGRVRIAVDGYRSWIHDFIGHLRAITPNVFLDRQTLEAYLLSRGMDANSAATIAAAASSIPVGTITPREALDPTDIILAVRNFGDVSLWGTDATLTAEVTREWSIGATHSWVSRDVFPGSDGLGEIALDAPARKGSIWLTYRTPEVGISGTLEARFRSGFPVESGDYSGRVSGYTLIDCRLAYRGSAMGKATISAAADNLFDVRHQEFLGSPAIGRLLLVQVRTEF